GLSFAPDSAWLAWSQPGPRPLSRIRLARLDGSPPVDVTDGRFADDEPVFSTDGKYLAFLSRRSFDPVYDAHFFDLSFPYGCRPYLVPLAAATPSPFAPLSQGRAVSEERPGSGAGPDRERAGSDEPPTVTVDLAGLAARVVAVPVPEAQYSSLQAVAGGFAWLRHPVTGVLGEGLADPDQDRPRPALERFGLGRRECTELAAELDWFEVSGDGRQLVIRDHGELRVVPSERKAEQDDPAACRVDLARARFLADPAAQRRHAFDEAGRFMRHDFWVPDLAEVDWDAVLGSYRELLPRLATPDDFADLLWEVFGELGTSHAYVRAAGGDGDQPGRVGMLGADLEQGPDGRWRVSRVLPAEPSDPRARSPLAAAGAVVGPGTALLAVDGRPVDPVTGPGPLLAGAARKPVELTLSDGGGERRVVVTPLTSDRRLRYQDWVSANRRQVRELSGGRAGYLHVPDMMGEGWAHLHRDLRTEMAQDALVIDVRHNRGGHVSELVVEKLARRIMGWDLGRNVRPVTYPHDAPRGPVVALADEFAGSDGDMVTAAIRILGLGPVVGARTWGGVVGIDGFHTLADGTGMTVPRYAIWLDGFGWGVENHGVDPDVEVLRTPGDWASGRDPQLETAVALAVESLASRPPARAPGTGSRPSRRRSPLPPRQQAATVAGS
ncbi:MAG: PDZ domain-containing protein, partial [Actinobacteria bacterium]|nr:PDZ domain-containing protein [Actinomycetota bacterium]